MPDTRTERMLCIADYLWDEGQYTRAMSVEAVTRERDLFRAAVVAIVVAVIALLVFARIAAGP